MSNWKDLIHIIAQSFFICKGSFPMFPPLFLKRQVLFYFDVRFLSMKIFLTPSDHKENRLFLLLKKGKINHITKEKVEKK